ncbi:Protein kinase-like domain protein [Lasiodiplodia theobromae]|uniref:Protein kinase-like domain protein n=1 Tax=Lasiodiplodia theobromae TaxID=45133 RepID=UPI0015C2F27C|nr:Protein kinase-like domain protein [Lasiodiplodia theobromae]KAF4546388.1 Protein kinase-like domain protein [Lasiodiplodia theobromae]
MEDISGRTVVIGFLLEFHQDGSLSNTLPLEHMEGNRPIDRQIERIRWARQVTEALIHVQHQCKTFYSDIKTENILLGRQRSGKRDVLLIDFEQRGASNAWTAPEVIYIERLRSILNVVEDHAFKKRYEGLWYDMTGSQFSITEKLYSNPPDGYNVPWISMTAEEQEAAEVFGLGKLMEINFTLAGKQVKMGNC